MNTIVVAKGTNGGFVITVNGFTSVTNTINYRTGTSLELYDSIGKLIGLGSPEDFTVNVSGTNVTNFTTIAGVLDSLSKVNPLGNGIKVLTSTGSVTSLQIPMFDVITNLTTANFTLPGNASFRIKNDGADEVTLEVMPELGSTYISTTFAHGWNPEIVKAVKLNAVAMNLKWGY